MSKELKECKFCFEKINEKARRCPHCQADLRGFVDRHPIISILLGIIFLIFTFFAIAFSVDNTPENSSVSTSTSQTKPNPTEIGRGKYKSYNYYISQDASSSKYVVIFNPFLPRNDTIVAETMLEMINQVYGKHNVADLKPKIEEREGVNLIMFKGVKNDFYFLLVKEDSGEVNSFTFWSE
jgi:hypothetical protein